MLGPPVCVECKQCYEQMHYLDYLDGIERECVRWYCPKCLNENAKYHAMTISYELFEEIFGPKNTSEERRSK